MSDSNAEWGSLATDEQRQEWDGYGRIPEPGQNPALDSFLVSKRLDHGALIRFGTRMSGPSTLAFGYDGGIKFRRLIDGRKFSYLGSTFDQLKIIRGDDRDTVIICEGETDAMRLSMLFDCDVAVMPVGARAWFPAFAEQVKGYDRILVGLDNDEAGDDGFTKIKATNPRAVRFGPPPPASDWCELDTDVVPLPDLPPPGKDETLVLVNARDLLAYDVPDQSSWFSGALLPIGGTAVLHATFKSFKTWIALDLATALATAHPFAGFAYATDRPARVAYFNFEIPWAYYQERVRRFAEAAADREAFLDNFYGYQPITRPHLVTGNTESEDAVIANLTEGGIDVVVIDPIRRAMGFASMNDENEVRRPLHFAERLNRLGITVVLVHHDNKESDKQGGGDPAGMTGSGAWAGDVDSIISVSRPSGFPRDDTRRNVGFLLRNAPSPDPQGFMLPEQGPMVWQADTWVQEIRDAGPTNVLAPKEAT